MAFKPLRIFCLILLFFIGFLFPSWAVAASPLKIYASTSIGYDNNSLLNAQRKEDAFAQESASLYYQSPLSDLLGLRLSSYLLNVNYFEQTDQNVFLPVGSAGLDFFVAKATTLQLDYEFEYIDFPNNESATSLNHKGRVGLNQVLSDQWTIRGGMGLSSSDYESRKLRQANGVLSAIEERSDSRYTADSELIFRALKNLLLKSGFIYYFNDSNDVFHDYYDYHSYKYYASSFLQIDPKFSAYFKFSYENRDYHSRPLADHSAISQNDDIYTATASLFYKIHANVSLGANYSYRQKNSNEPSQKYSGSIFTVGLYYFF